MNTTVSSGPRPIRSAVVSSMTSRMAGSRLYSMPVGAIGTSTWVATRIADATTPSRSFMGGVSTTTALYLSLIHI